MLKGDKTVLRSIEEEDLEQLRNWRNLPEFRQYFREYKELSKQDQQSWYENIVQPKKNEFMFAIVNKETNALMGACGLCCIDWLRKSADMSIYLGFQSLYLDDIYAVDAAKTLISYGFNEIGLHRIWAEVYSHDNKKQAFFQMLGFTQDGRFRESHWTNGAWVDSIYYSLLSTDRLNF